MTTPTTLAERLARVRHLAGDLSQRELASLAGLSTNHVSAIERGKIATIGTETAKAIHLVTSVRESWILLGTGYPPTPGKVKAAVKAARAARASVRP